MRIAGSTLQHSVSSGGSITRRTLQMATDGAPDALGGSMSAANAPVCCGGSTCPSSSFSHCFAVCLFVCFFFFLNISNRYYSSMTCFWWHIYLIVLHTILYEQYLHSSMMNIIWNNYLLYSNIYIMCILIDSIVLYNTFILYVIQLPRQTWPGQIRYTKLVSDDGNNR